MKKVFFILLACFAFFSFTPAQDYRRTAIPGTWDLVGIANFGVLSVLSMDDAELVHYLDRQMTAQSGMRVVFKNGNAYLYANGYLADTGDYEFVQSDGETCLLILWEEDIEYCLPIVHGNYLYLIPFTIDGDGNTNLSLKMTALKYRRVY